MKTKFSLKSLLPWLLLIFSILFSFYLTANITILQYKSRIIEAKDFTGAETALVFGGGMSDETTQSDMQEDRVKLAVDLYKQGKINKMIMTGDDGANRFDEITYMKKYAVDNGVAEEDILVDPHGYNTYTSCYRASKEWKLENIVAISQEFHLSRIIFFCSNFGINTVGVKADLREYGFMGRVWVMNIRESLARVKGLWQVYITKPGPLSFEK